MSVRMFYGEFTVRPPLSPEHQAYLRMFSRTCRVRRDPRKAELLPDPLRVAVGLPIGVDGAYYVGGGEYGGGWGDDTVVDHNEPPGMQSFRDYIPEHPISDAEHIERYRAYSNAIHEARMQGIVQPSLWCQWTPTDDGRAIVWDRGEKFEEHWSWLDYLLRHFLIPWGYVVTGRVDWEGPYEGDGGSIFVFDNEVHLA